MSDRHILGPDGRDEYGYDYRTRRLFSPYARRSCAVAVILTLGLYGLSLLAPALWGAL